MYSGLVIIPVCCQVVLWRMKKRILFSDKLISVGIRRFVTILMVCILETTFFEETRVKFAPAHNDDVLSYVATGPFNIFWFFIFFFLFFSFSSLFRLIIIIIIIIIIIFYFIFAFHCNLFHFHVKPPILLSHYLYLVGVWKQKKVKIITIIITIRRGFSLRWVSPVYWPWSSVVSGKTCLMFGVELGACFIFLFRFWLWGELGLLLMLKLGYWLDRVDGMGWDRGRSVPRFWSLVS